MVLQFVSMPKAHFDTNISVAAMDCHEILILSGVLSKWYTMVPNLFFICLANFVSTKVDLAAFILATRKYLVPSMHFFPCLKKELRRYDKNQLSNQYLLC